MVIRIEPNYYEDKNGCHICTSHCRIRGYPLFYRDGKRWLMSRWFYTQKYGEIPKGKIIRHKCDNPACINIDHLELGTHKDNSQDMVKRGRSTFGEKSYPGKLTEQQVLEIYHDRGRTNAEIAKEYGISSITVSNIQSGDTWAHLFKKHGIIPKGKGHNGEFQSRSKLTTNQVIEIRKLHGTGKHTQIELAKKYDMSKSAIGAIIKKENWKHIN